MKLFENHACEGEGIASGSDLQSLLSLKEADVDVKTVAYTHNTGNQMYTIFDACINLISSPGIKTFMVQPGKCSVASG